MKNQDYTSQNDTEAYEMAVKRVKKLKGFYTHLLVYVIINIFIYVVNVRGSHGDYFALQNFTTAFFWGIGLLAHATSVFVPEIVFGKNWEERKIREFMEKEERNKYE
jgi:hypothetical protein